MALVTVVSPGPALAVDAVTGKSLYNNSVGPAGSTCASSSCHTGNPASGANNVRKGANNPTAIQNGINSDAGGMGAYKGKLSSTDLANIAGFIGITAAVSPLSMTFPATTVGATAAAQTVTVTSTGVSTLQVKSFSSSAEFPIVSGGTCTAGISLAGYNTSTAKYTSCTLRVGFTPTATGSRSGTLSISSSDPAAATTTVSLSGTATAGAQPAASIAPVSLSYGSIAVGTQSAAQTVTIGNTGAGALNISSIASSSTDFPLSGGTCAVGTPVPASTGSCTVLVRFAPQSAGAKSATLSIAHDAPGSPSTVALSGTGTAATPVAQLSPSALSFSQTVGTTSAVQTLTLSNTGTAALAISTVALGGTDAGDFATASGSTCTGGGSVAAGSSCTIGLSFTPSAAGARSASLSIAHNDTAHNPSTAALSGTGTAAASGQVSLNKTSMSFPAQPQNSKSAAQPVIVTNSGSAPLTLSSIALSGANAANYAVEAAGSSCNTSTAMAVNGNCSISLSFTPTTASGTRVAALDVGSSSSASSASMSLSGIAAPAAAPLVSFSPGSLDYGSYAVGQTSPAQSLTLSNSGAAALAIGGLTVTPSDYTLSHNCPASLAAGSACTLSIRFAPAAAGSIAGSLTLLSNAATSPDHVALSGIGAATTGGLLDWQNGSGLIFPDTTLNTASPALTLTLANQGSASATLQQLQIGGPNAADFSVDPASTCAAGSSLVPGANCVIAMVFSPSGGGARSASLSVVSDAGGPSPVPLSGNGIADGTPVLTLSPQFINLAGDVNGGLQPQSLALQNDGGGVLTVSSIAAPAQVQVLDASMNGGGSCATPPFSLQPAMACTLMIAPVGSGPINGTLQVFSNAAATPGTATISGVALSNAGAASGGCSLGPPGAPFDPIWALLCLTAVLVLLRRNRHRQ